MKWEKSNAILALKCSTVVVGAETPWFFCLVLVDPRWFGTVVKHTAVMQERVDSISGLKSERKNKSTKSTSVANLNLLPCASPPSLEHDCAN